MALFRRKSSEDDEPVLVEPTENDKLSTNPGDGGVSDMSNDSTAGGPGGAADSGSNRDDKPSEGASMASSKSSSAGFVPEIPRRTIDLPGAPARRPQPAQRTPASTEGKKLIVGREISLSGQINA